MWEEGQRFGHKAVKQPFRKAPTFLKLPPGYHETTLPLGRHTHTHRLPIHGFWPENNYFGGTIKQSAGFLVHIFLWH